MHIVNITAPEVTIAAALCFVSLLAWIYLASAFWQSGGSTSKGKIELNEDAPSALDDDILVDVEQWERRILYTKIPCTVIAAIAAVSSTVSACSIINRDDDALILASWLQAAFWVSLCLSMTSLSALFTISEE